MAAASTPVAAPAQAVDTTRVKAEIAEIWSTVLGVQGLSGRDNFFELGGHSLLAVQAHRAIRDGLGAKGLSITDIFRFPVLADLAERVAGLTGGVAAPAPKRAAPEGPVVPSAPETETETATETGVGTETGRAAPEVAPALNPRAQMRADLMNRRREMRAKRRA